VGSTNEAGDYDTVLVVNEQTGSGVSGLVENDCTDDSSGTHQSLVSFTALPNTTYYLLVGSSGTTDGGDLKLNVTHQ
jgi:hypothetical protein